MNRGYNLRFDFNDPAHLKAHELLVNRDKKKYRKAADLVSAAILAYDPYERKIVLKEEDIKVICRGIVKEMENNGMFIPYDEIGI